MDASGAECGVIEHGCGRVRGGWVQVGAGEGVGGYRVVTCSTLVYNHVHGGWLDGW